MSTLRIDIVSDVVCPWCIIGYKRLEVALEQLSDLVVADIHWHPFELNPAMPIEGQNLKEHLAAKYGTSDEASASARETLTQLGADLGFQFDFYDEMRIYNTRKAHQLLMWAQSDAKQQALELALFKAYFSKRMDISQTSVLIEIATSVGLDAELAQKVIDDPSWAETVASTEQQWIEAGINAVPAIILNQKHLIAGAQSSQILVDVITEVVTKELAD
ncbi:DsbA family oxidoreductase [Vibrio paucivorans]